MQLCLEPLAVLVVAIALRLRPLGALMEAFALFAAVPPAADERVAMDQKRAIRMFALLEQTAMDFGGGPLRGPGLW